MSLEGQAHSKYLAQLLLSGVTTTLTIGARVIYPVKSACSILFFSFLLAFNFGCNSKSAEHLVASSVQEAGTRYEENQQGETSKGHLTLENGLQVLIVSNPNFTKSSASMSVPVGSWSDPWEHQGLAHYLEHMLFLGTDLFPNPGEYNQFMSSNGGYSNAYTSYELTNYHFEVNTAVFEEALLRFSRFFISPTLNPEFSEKEKKAVQSEFDKNIMNDGWRFWRIAGLSAPKAHPHRKFNIGSTETLANVTPEILSAFFQKYYSADTMRLSIVTNKPLAEIKETVMRQFSEVPKREKAARDVLKDLPPRDAKKWIEIKPVGEMNELYLTFYLPEFKPHWKIRPDLILAKLLGSQGQGSLAASLRAENLASSFDISAGDVIDIGNDAATLTMWISLTEKGAANTDKVLEKVMAYIGQMKREGIKSYIPEELKIMTGLGFENRGLVDGANEAVRYANSMLSHPALEIDERTMLISQSDESLLIDYLSQLQANQLSVFRLHSGAKVNTVDPIYGIEYSIEEIPKTTQELLKAALEKTDSAFSYPPANPYVPKNMDLLTDEATEMPVLITEDSKSEIWFLQESGSLAKPLAYSHIKILSQEFSTSARNYLLAQILTKAIGTSHRKRLTPFSEAGFNISFDTSSEGLGVSISGYSDAFSLALQEIVGSTTHPLNILTISDEDLNTIKESLAQDFANHEQLGAIDRLGIEYGIRTLKPAYAVSDYKDQLPSITLKELNEFSNKAFKKSKVEALFYGNLKKSQLNEIGEKVLTSLKASPMSLAEYSSTVPKEIVLNEGENIEVDVQGKNNNFAIYIKADMGPRQPVVTARTLLTGSLLEQEYYNELRTNQQLGYIVWGGSTSSRGKAQLLFAIQSANHKVEELKKRSDAFILSLSQSISKKLSEETLAKLKTALISEISRKPVSMQARFETLNLEFKRGTKEWNYFELVAQALEKVGLEEIIPFAQKALDPSRQTKVEMFYRPEQ